MNSTQPSPILIVDGNSSVPAELVDRCTQLGYRLLYANDGSEGLRLFFQHRPQLVITEVSLAGLTGLELVIRIREVSAIPIIIHSALDAEGIKVQALRIGADDYVVKPTGIQELLARVEAVLRRARLPSVETDQIYSDGVLTIDFGRQEAFLQDNKLDLTPLELKILVYLSQRAGNAVSVLDLLNGVWGSPHFSEDVVKWHIANLRKKLSGNPRARDLIVTVWGTGYRYERPPTECDIHQGSDTKARPSLVPSLSADIPHLRLPAP